MKDDFSKTIPQKKYLNLFLLGVITLLTVIVYFKSLDNQFLHDWDDGIYITNNEDIKSDDAVKKAFTGFSNGHYHPLTTLSYIAEYNLFGLNPKAYHTTNLILHMLNAFLVFGFIWLLVKQSLVAFITALLFAIHPMHVESIAWISDRKDLLCTLFYVGALCMYIIYNRDKNTKLYVVTFLLFGLALFSKAMAVTLPVLFFMVDYFMGIKFSRKSATEKLPFLALSVVFGYISIISQKSNDALGDFNTIGFFEKIIFSSYSIIMYLFKLVSFSDLSAFYNYPLTENGKYPVIFYIMPFILGALIWLLYKAKQHKKLIWFGFGFFLVTIVLVLQFIPAGNVIMADRYTYIPYIGLFFIIASLITNAISKSKLTKNTAVIGLCIYVVTCCYYSFNRTKIWNNSLVFWNDTIKKNPDAALPYCNRAALFIGEKEVVKAISDLNRAIEIRPKYVTAHFNRGMAFLQVGKFEEAILDFSFVLQNKCRDIVAVYMNRASAFMYAGDYRKAIEDYSAALSYNPNIGQAYYMRAVSLFKMQDYKQAWEDALTAQKMRYPVERDFMENLLSKVKQ